MKYDYERDARTFAFPREFFMSMIDQEQRTAVCARRNRHLGHCAGDREGRLRPEAAATR